VVAVTKIKLEPNVVVTGTVKFVDFYAEKENPNQPGKVMAAQWALNGAWSWIVPGTDEQMHAEGKIYIDEYQLAASPVALGFVEPNGTWDDGNPKFKWTYKAAVRLLKTEDGKKRHVTISRLTDSPAGVGAAPAPLPVGHGTPAQASRPPQAVPTPTPAPHTDPWSDLARSYERAHVLACKVWGDNYEPSALVAAAATIFIEANKRGLKATNPIESFAGMPEPLKQDEAMPWDQ
jgi:hypothetical protein